MSDHASQYIGLDMHTAHGAAHANGHQLRVLHHAGRKFLYAEPPEAGHILVEIDKNGNVTAARIAT